MTRKEELHAWANNFLHQHHHFKNGKPRNCDLECLREMLLDVEREVWEKAAKIVEGGRFITDSSLEAQWAKAVTSLLRQQQEGL